MLAARTCKYGRLSIIVWTSVHTSVREELMGGGSGGQGAMAVVWVVLILLAVGGFAGFSLLRRRGKRTGADRTGNGR